MSLVAETGPSMESKSNAEVTQAFQEMGEVLNVLIEHGIKPSELRKRLESPPMTVMNIQMFLNQCTTDQLAKLFYTSGLVKLAEIAKQSHENQQQAAQPSEPTPV